jgi:hypothetical protein
MPEDMFFRFLIYNFEPISSEAISVSIVAFLSRSEFEIGTAS